MAQETPTLIKSELSDNIIQPNRFVKKTSTGVDVATGGTDKIMGVCNQDTVNVAGDTVPVVVAGTVRVVASAGITVGDWVTSTSAGKAITTTSTNDIVRGMALETAGANNDIIEILLVLFHHN